MNKREKEVIQSQLDKEKAVMKKLEQQYQRALNDIINKTKILQADIDMLQAAGEADDRTLSMMRSKVYQKQYQQALQRQIIGILDKLHSDEYSTIQGFLNGCYEDGFIGAMYSLQAQGIPIIAPIDTSAAVKAVQLDSKVVEGYYKHLGVDFDNLKKVIPQEVSRGIASSLPYTDIARNLNNASKSGLNNAKRIARTEGHRIQQQSAEDARQAARKKGADVVKQWDASLDGRTRDSHRRVDGEIRENDEKFSNGLMYAGDPNGSAAEVINCRCVTLTRARWALDEEELETLKERAEYFGLDKTENFEDYKKKFLTASEKQKEVLGSWIETGNLPPSINEFDDYDEYKKAVKAYTGSQKYVANSEWNNNHVYDEAEMRNAKRFDATIAQLQEKYPLPNSQKMIIGDYDVVQHNLNEKQIERIGDEATAQHWINPDTNTAIIGFKPNQTTTSFDEDLLRRQKAIDKGEVLSEVFFNSAEGTAIHEYGHEMSEYLTTGMIFDDSDAMDYWKWYKSLDKDEIRKGLSDYAATNRWEFEAEAFAELQTSNPRPIAKKYGEYLEKLMGKGYDISTIDDGLSEKFARKLDTSSIKTIILPKDEYAHVMSEIATHLSDRQKKQKIVTKAIGKYNYTFENNGFGDYRIIGKKLIDEEAAEWWGD